MQLNVKQNYKLPTQIGEGKPDTVVIFIHGLGGAKSTWFTFAKVLKESWNKDSSFKTDFDQYYSSGLLTKIPFLKKFLLFLEITFGPDLNTLGNHLDAAIKQYSDDCDNVIIVAHSMGGLIVRK
jgi:pimeloyl-ACP methyl ester carboxylesterase